MFSLRLGKVKINNPAQTERRLGLEKDGPGQEHLRDTFDRFMDPYIPLGSGPLKNTKTYPSKHSIKYTSPYAHYHYIGKKAIGASKPKGVKRTISGMDMKYTGAPKRGPKWDKRMYSDRKNDVLRDLENFLKKGGK
jgi:hypothetical protein